METIARRGAVTFRNDTPAEYPVFRNVKDFGAKGSWSQRRICAILTLLGDGIADDTTAINNAVAFPGTLGIQPHGNSTRCGGGVYPAGQDCGSSTLQPAIVYFPPGTYRITRSIVLWYMTQAIGNMPLVQLIGFH